MPNLKLARTVVSLLAALLFLVGGVPLDAWAEIQSAPQTPSEAASGLREPNRHKVRRGKWIEIVLSQQRLIAWENGRTVMTTLISSGTSRWPTVRGTFRITRKFVRQRLRGPDYDLPNVPHMMYFYQGYSLHGTYWHNDYGAPRSHGCVNILPQDAKWVFRWTQPATRYEERWTRTAQRDEGSLIKVI